MTLRKYQNRKTVALSSDATVYDVARAMADQQIGAVVLIEHSRVVGIVTDRDIVLDVVANTRDPREVRAAAVMRPNVATLDVDASVADAVELMRMSACRRIPLTEGERLVGIVTLDDLLLDRALSAEAIASIVGAQLELAHAWSERNRQGEGAPLQASVIGRHMRLRQRHQAHADATYAHLLHRVVDITGLKTRDQAEIALLVALEGICRRIPAGEARHFLAQLPSVVQDELAACAAGPDRDITTETIEAELRLQLELGELEAASVLNAVGTVLSATLSPGLVESVRTNLPAGMKELFPRA